MLVNPEEILTKKYTSIPFRYSRCPKVNLVYPFGNKLGELIMLSSIPSKAKAENVNVYLGIDSQNKYLQFSQFIADYVKPPETEPVRTFQSVVENNYCGNGNLSQQVHRILGLKHETIPRGNILINPAVKKGRIGIHVDGVGAGTISYDIQARILNQLSLMEIQKFIDSNPKFEFYQFGDFNKTNIHIFKGCHIQKDLDLIQILENIGSCEYFVCINSGFYHAAIALNCKTICLINRPNINLCYIPILRWNNFYGVTPQTYDHNWLYPQAVHLHELSENELVKSITEKNLSKAINGEIYPFWETKYCNLTKLWET